MPRIKEVKPPRSVWSSYGHRFMSTDDPMHDSCLVCGAMFMLVWTPDGPAEGDYATCSGEAVKPCTGDTSMVHAYPGEGYCHACDAFGDEPCQHMAHGCNCLFCDS